jgi:hypothetical protein
MSTSESTAAISKTPTLYMLHGHGLQVTYSTTSINGTPRFDYHDSHGTHAFVGDEQIRTQPTEIGTLVSVTIQLTVDSGSTSFTLLVPTVNLGKATSAPISTIGITTRHRFSINQSLNLGQTELYTVTHLTGTAEDVDF